ncbi:MAG: hypothetical protein K2X27_05670 [Candidatus Obscuribacterales bacterium]|nr:hypothetical protein [Candidatus Obscuribacterales bacterium]
MDTLLKILKPLGMGLLAWLGLIAFIHMALHMSSDCEMSAGGHLQMLPVSALLCLFPSIYMLCDYLNKNPQN